MARLAGHCNQCNADGGAWAVREARPIKFQRCRVTRESPRPSSQAAAGTGPSQILALQAADPTSLHAHVRPTAATCSDFAARASASPRQTLQRRYQRFAEFWPRIGGLAPVAGTSRHLSFPISKCSSLRCTRRFSCGPARASGSTEALSIPQAPSNVGRRPGCARLACRRESTCCSEWHRQSAERRGPSAAAACRRSRRQKDARKGKSCRLFALARLIPMQRYPPAFWGASPGDVAMFRSEALSVAVASSVSSEGLPSETAQALADARWAQVQTTGRATRKVPALMKAWPIVESAPVQPARRVAALLRAYH